MELAVAHSRIMPKSKALEKRRFQRVNVSLLGRYMLLSQREFPCQVLNFSPGGVSFIAPEAGLVGELVIAYIDHIGRIEGKIARIITNGFAMTIEATPRKRDKLATQLTWLANRHVLGMPEDRRHERIIPRNPTANLTLPDGSTQLCRLIDVSLSGAAVSLQFRPTVGTPVLLGRIRARVVRHLESGIALEFASIQDPEQIDHQLR